MAGARRDGAAARGLRDGEPGGRVDLRRRGRRRVRPPRGRRAVRRHPRRGRAGRRRPRMQPAEGYGGAELDGESLVARSVGGEGGADLPNIVAPRSTDEGTTGGLVEAGAADGRRPGRCRPRLTLPLRPRAGTVPGHAPDAVRVRGWGRRVPGPGRGAPRPLPRRPGAQPPVLARRPEPGARPAPRRLLGRGAGRAAAVLGAVGRPVLPAAAARGQRRHGRPRPAVRRVLRGGGRRRRAAGRPRVPGRPARLHGVGRGRRPGVLADGRRRPRRAADARAGRGTASSRRDARRTNRCPTSSRPASTCCSAGSTRP